METLLTFGLVSVILGTASGAQNVGVIGALGVDAYIALAGLWGSPISDASMNPARTFGPDLVSLTCGRPAAGRDHRGGLRIRAARAGRRPVRSAAAQGNLFIEVGKPDRATSALPWCSS